MIANPGDYITTRYDKCAKCGKPKPVDQLVRAPRASCYCGKMICAACIDAPVVRSAAYNPVTEVKRCGS